MEFRQVRLGLSGNFSLHNSDKRGLGTFAALQATVRPRVLQNQAITATICIVVNRAEYRTARSS